MSAVGHRLRAALLGFGLVVATAAATADSVEAMCVELGRGEEVCDCAAERLRERVGDPDYALYREVGAVYRERLAEGMAMGDAWHAGVRAAARARGADLMRINRRVKAVGRAHRNAMGACA